MNAQFACSESACTTVNEHRKRSGIKCIEPLREKRGDHAAKHIARASLGKLGTPFDNGTQLTHWCRDKRLGAFEHDRRIICASKRDGILVAVGDLASQQTCGLPLMRREDARMTSRRLE